MSVQKMNTLIELLRIVASEPADFATEWETAEHTRMKLAAARQILRLSGTVPEARQFVQSAERSYHENQTLTECIAEATCLAKNFLPLVIQRRSQLSSRPAKERFQDDSVDPFIPESNLTRDALYFVPEDEESIHLDHFGNVVQN
jgi:hypothetical protein